MSGRRQPCCVIGCGCTRRFAPDIICVEGVDLDFAAEWVCERHWRTVPARLKALKRKARRELRKAATMRFARIDARIWKWCKAAAIEAETGLR